MRNRSSVLVTCFVALLCCALIQLPGLAQEDVGNATESPSFKMFPLGHVEAKQAERVLQTLMAGREDVRMEVAEDINAVILLGRPSDFQVVEDLLLLLDRQPHRQVAQMANQVVRITWLVDQTTLSTDQQKRLELPEALTVVGRTLSGNGSLATPGVLTSLTTLVSPISASEQRGGQDFNNTSQQRFGENNHVINAKGSLTQAGNNQFHLNLQLELSTDDVTTSMQTTITLPKNHPLVFSIASLGTLKSAVVVELVDPE